MRDKKPERFSTQRQAKAHGYSSRSTWRNQTSEMQNSLPVINSIKKISSQDRLSGLQTEIAQVRRWAANNLQLCTLKYTMLITWYRC